MELHNFKNKKLIQNRIGRQYWIWDSDKLYEQRLARENGPYQARNLVFLRNCLPNARTIIDVGANIGMNTIEYATWAKSIKSFEPMNSTYELLKMNVDIAKKAKLKGKYYNIKEQKYQHDPSKDDGWYKMGDRFASLNLIGDIEMFNVALGNDNKDIMMEEVTKHCSRGDAILRINETTFSNIFDKDLKPEAKNPTQESKMKTIDSYGFDDVDIIKADTEGTEYWVLQGAKQTIEKHQPVVQVELRKEHCEKYGYDPQDLVDYMMDLGDYVMCDMNAKDLGKAYSKEKGVMDRFFVGRELYQSLEKKNRAYPNTKTENNTFSGIFQTV